MFTYQVLNGTDISCCGAFVIVCVPFLPVTVKPISSGGTVKMTLDVFSEVNRRCQGKISFIVMFQVYTRILTWKPVRCFPRHVFSTNSRVTTFIAVLQHKFLLVILKILFHLSTAQCQLYYQRHCGKPLRALKLRQGGGGITG